MKTRYLALGVLAVAASAYAFKAFGPGTLTIAGSPVETNFITQNNRVYVPLADVAKALKYEVSKTSNGFSLDPAGGANQINGVNGKIGDVVNLGYATVKVVKVIKSGELSRKVALKGIGATAGAKAVIEGAGGSVA